MSPAPASEPERPTLPFRAVVAVPGQEETAADEEGPLERETRAEETCGTLPYEAVLAAPGPARRSAPDALPGDPQLSGARTEPPSEGWTPAPPPALRAPERFEPGAALPGGFQLREALGEEPLGVLWLAAHPRFGPCEVLTLAPALAAQAGPQLLLSARLCVGQAGGGSLEEPLASGAEPSPWVAWRREVAPSLTDAALGSPQPRALQWARDLSGGLAALHAQRAALGDPSPARARVPSLGPARWAQVGLGVLRAPERLAPERRAGGGPDEASDLYAFAATLERLAELAGSGRDARGLRALAQGCARADPALRLSARELCARLDALLLRERRDWRWVGWLALGAGLGALLRHLLG